MQGKIFQKEEDRICVCLVHSSSLLVCLYSKVSNNICLVHVDHINSHETYNIFCRQVISQYIGHIWSDKVISSFCHYHFFSNYESFIIIITNITGKIKLANSRVNIRSLYLDIHWITSYKHQSFMFVVLSVQGKCINSVIHWSKCILVELQSLWTYTHVIDKSFCNSKATNNCHALNDTVSIKQVKLP
jgi:hypothetical protein